MHAQAPAREAPETGPAGFGGVKSGMKFRVRKGRGSEACYNRGTETWVRW
ncbi:MAG: hypothetical protein OJF55_000857 [Rhodanobacteraceae bacterium]|nr:MAG: hypothetical protein OJF55_000857 [Rhodanobacteraceae bacterium]